MSVIFLPEVRKYYYHLEEILYDKGYLGFKESSRSYVQKLINDIETTLPIRPHRPAPVYFDKYGKDMKYAIFRVGKSKHTTWYAFFKTYKEHGEIVYVARYIANNHIIAQYL